VQGMLAYYSCDEIRPPSLLYFLLEEIRDRRSFSQAGNCVHGVQNEPFSVCVFPPRKRSVFRDWHTKTFRRIPPFHAEKCAAIEFDEWPGSLTALSAGEYYSTVAWYHMRNVGESTKQTHETYP
jgi:hypothetical protein